jgi:hypothetical protein
MTLLNDPEWSTWSDNQIALRCQVDHKTVARHRDQLIDGKSTAQSASHLGNSQDRPRTVKRGASTYTQKTAKIGKPKSSAGVEKHATATTAAPDITPQVAVPVSEPESPSVHNKPIAGPEPAVEDNAPVDHHLAFEGYIRQAEGAVECVREMFDVPGWVNIRCVTRAMKIAAQWQDLANELGERIAGHGGDEPADDGQVDLEDLLRGSSGSAAGESLAPEAELAEIARRVTQLKLKTVGPDVPRDCQHKILAFKAGREPGLVLEMARLLERSWALFRDIVPSEGTDASNDVARKRLKQWRSWAGDIHVIDLCSFLREFCKKHGGEIVLPHTGSKR